MLHSGKKITLHVTKVKYILTLVLSEKKNSERKIKPYPPPPRKLNGRSLTQADTKKTVRSLVPDIQYFLKRLLDFVPS